MKISLRTQLSSYSRNKRYNIKSNHLSQRKKRNNVEIMMQKMVWKHVILYRYNSSSNFLMLLIDL